MSLSNPVPVTEVYWEEFYANQNPNESQNHPESESRNRQNHPNQSQNEDIEMTIYEDVGNEEEVKYLFSFQVEQMRMKKNCI